MANYQSQFTGEQIDTAVGKVDEKLDKTGGEVRGDILPNVGGSWDLGSETRRWNKVHAYSGHFNAGIYVDGLSSGLLKANSNGQIITAAASDVLGLIRDSLYPVGSIKFETTYTNPGTYLGGTWEIWGSGRFPLGVPINDQEIGGQADLTGGEKTHTLTIDEMPSHAHTPNVSGRQMGVNAGESAYWHVAADQPWQTASTGVTTTNTGGGKAHNNMPPYITCYMWKRTA